MRREVREFLAEELRHMSPRQRAETWNGIDPEFSRPPRTIRAMSRETFAGSEPCPGSGGMSELHDRTRRLWAWRADHGSEAFWADRLGRWAGDQGADALWSALTQRRQ